MPSDKLLINFVIDDDLLASVEAYRRAQPKIPPRSAAIKAIIRRGLACIEQHADPEPPTLPPPR